MTTAASTTPTAPAPKRSSWLRRLAWLIATFVVLLVGSYFVITSGAFFKAVILPKVGQAMNARVTVTDATIQPFSAVTLRGVTIQTVGTEPAVSVDEVRLRYHLRAILGGTLKVDEVALVGPKVRVVRNADGTSNLDPILQGDGNKPTAPSTPAPASSHPPQVDLGKVTISDGSVQVLQKGPDGIETRIELNQLNFALTDVRNGQTAHLNIGGVVQWYSGSGTSNSSVKADLKTELNFGLTPLLGLELAKGGLSVSVREAIGEFAQLAGLRTVVQCDVTPTEVKELAWRTFRGERQLSELTLAGPMDLAKKEGTLDLALSHLDLADWQGAVPGLEPVGSIQAKGKVTAREAGQDVGFDLKSTVQGLGALLGSQRLSQLGVSLAMAGRFTHFNQLQLQGAELALSHQGLPTARIRAAGSVDLARRRVELSLGADVDLARLTRILPQPDVQIATGQVQIAGAKILQQGVQQTVSGGLTLTNLTGTVAGKEFKAFALGSSFDVVATGGTLIELRRVALYLAETARAKSNHVELSGRLDLTRTNALEGALTLSSSSLDVTPYYDWLDQQATNAAGTTASTSTTPTPGSTNAPIEPDPLQLPVRQLVVDARIGRLWLREVEASNILATITVQTSRVTIRPLALIMNGAPATADVDLDLSVKGWRYAVRANAAGLPIAPLADSFAPEYRGRARGELWADIKIDGAGVTGPSLRTNLVGNFGLTFTNADIQIVGPRLKGFLTPIATALNAPGLLGSPLKWVGFGASMGSGKLGLSQLALVSPMFAAATHGEVTLAETPGKTRLSSWPMALQLDRTLAERLKLAPKDTPTNVSLVAMPGFVTVAGTVSTPKPDIDYQALAGAALLKYADKIPGMDERTSGLLKSAAGLLTGPRAGATNNPAETGINAPAGAGLLDFLKRPKAK